MEVGDRDGATGEGRDWRRLKQTEYGTRPIAIR